MRSVICLTFLFALFGASPLYAADESFAQFIREVRAEARKITWTTRKETWITSVMVLIMVVMTATFFFIVDLLLSFGVSQILKLSTLGS